MLRSSCPRAILLRERLRIVVGLPAPISGGIASLLLRMLLLLLGELLLLGMWLLLGELLRLLLVGMGRQLVRMRVRMRYKGMIAHGTVGGYDALLLLIVVLKIIIIVVQLIGTEQSRCQSGAGGNATPRITGHRDGLQLGDAIHRFRGCCGSCHRGRSSGPIARPGLTRNG